ncbi:MAG: BatA domain-containing protein [Planctomycetota bacterium]|nr:BatA domain-containing protein [Planctomycetota bacterium]
MLEGFLHPALAFGALLAAVPLIIHLLNRQRHQPLEWAAMRFVLAAYRRTRRRAQLENLLLLLLRMAAVALLAFAVARPFLGRNSSLAPLTESRRDVVLILDGSASTGYRAGVETVFDGIVERARTILNALDETRGDRARLILAAASPRLLATRSPEDALAVLSTLSSPTNEALDLAATLAEVVRFAEEDAAGSGLGGIEIRLLTDLQRNVFTPRIPAAPPVPVPGEAPQGDVPPLFAALDKLDDLGLTVIVEDHGAGALDPGNLAVESITTFGPVAGPGTTVEIGVSVASYGHTNAVSVRLALEIDGERQPSRLVELPARGTTEVVLAVVFQDSGYHTVAARLDGDRLPIDDVRSRVVRVPPPVRILLVNGDEQPRIDEDEIGYLRAVLEPPDDGWLGGLLGRGRAPFQTRIVSDLDLAGDEIDLADYDVIVLANAVSPSQRTTERLEARVAAGAALLITVGSNVENDDGWNARFWLPDGSGLLPAEIGRRIEVADRRRGYFRAASFDQSHPALAFFADDRWKPLFTEVPIWAFLTTSPLEDARVLARLDDDAAHPLLIERAYDRGRVLLWTTTIDPEWTKLPESPRTLVPLMHELLRYAGRGIEPARNVGVGTPLVAEVTSFPRGLTVVRPDGTRRTLDGEPVQVVDGVWSLPAVTPTDQVGIWTIEREGAPDVAFAVQFDPVESDLMRMGAAEVDALHPALRVVVPGESAEADGSAGESARGELWRWFAALCLAALVLESLFGAWIGHKRRLS